MLTSKIRHKLLRIFSAIAMLLKIIILKMDIIAAYLKNLLRQNNHLIYKKAPQGCKAGQDSLVCKSFKTLYRLKQVEKL